MGGQWKTQAADWNTKGRPLAGNPQVTDGSDLEATSNAGTVDGGNHRCGAVQNGPKRITNHLVVVSTGLVSGRTMLNELRDVCTGREGRTLSPYHHGPKLVVCGKTTKAVGDVAPHGEAEGIEFARVGQPDGGDIFLPPFARTPDPAEPPGSVYREVGL